MQTFLPRVLHISYICHALPQSVLQQNGGRSTKCVFSCFESTNYTCLRSMNYLYMWYTIFENDENVMGWKAGSSVTRKSIFANIFPPASVSFSRWQVQTGKRIVMFLWEMSNNRRQAKFKTRLLLVAWLFNANHIFNCPLLPSFIALARKMSSLFPQFVFPTFFFQFGYQ